MHIYLSIYMEVYVYMYICTDVHLGDAGALQPPEQLSRICTLQLGPSGLFPNPWKIRFRALRLHNPRNINNCELDECAYEGTTEHGLHVAGGTLQFATKPMENH